jgi:hypothetical protein
MKRGRAAHFRETRPVSVTRKRASAEEEARQGLREIQAAVRVLQASYDGRRAPQLLQGRRKIYQRSRPYDKERERRRNQTKKRKAFLAGNLKRWRRENPLDLSPVYLT